MIAKIKLDVGSTADVSQDLYDLLLEAFIAKAQSQGIDVEDRSLSLDDWEIQCVARRV
jgi:hypothetical protein